MKKNVLMIAVLSAVGIASIQPTLAGSNCGMNSNKPCANDKLIAKEPAYKSMNSNKNSAISGKPANLKNKSYRKKSTGDSSRTKSKGKVEYQWKVEEGSK